LSLRRAGLRADGKNGAVISGNTLQVTAPRIRPTQAAPTTIRGRFADSRLVTPSGTPPATGARVPSKPAPPLPAVEAQRAPDLGVIQQQQAAELERQRLEAARAAEEAARAAHAHAAAAQAQSANAAREEIVRTQASHQTQPASVPASTQPSGQGRGQQ
jgi:hypothetical protein